MNESRLRTLYEIAKVINSIEEITPLLNRIMDIALDILEGDRGFIILKEEEDLVVKVAKGIKGEDVLDFSKSIVQQVLEKNKELLIMNALENKNIEISKSIILKRITSALCVPLKFKGEIIGVIYVDRRGGEPFTQEDLEFLKAFAELAAISLRNVRTRENIQRENIFYLKELGRIYGVPTLIGESEKMKEVVRLLSKLIFVSSPVLIEGETGTGKELIAKIIHFAGPRAKYPFIPINVSAIPETLLESELFGYKKGTFTGADKDREGLFLSANGGTLFLDEISEMPFSLQAKLLRVIETKEIIPLGERKPKKIDVRIISATNKNLYEEVKKGNFRQDLFYRLKVLYIHLPPLRERKEDIPLLVSHFIKEFRRKVGKKIKGIKKDAIKMLMEYDWPGNVRELKNVIERAIVMSENEWIKKEDIIFEQREGEKKFPVPLQEYIKQYVLSVLEKYQGNKAKTAKALGVSKRWLYYKIKEWKNEI